MQFGWPETAAVGKEKADEDYVWMLCPDCFRIPADMTKDFQIASFGAKTKRSKIQKGGQWQEPKNDEKNSSVDQQHGLKEFGWKIGNGLSVGFKHRSWEEARRSWPTGDMALRRHNPAGWLTVACTESRLAGNPTSMIN